MAKPTSSVLRDVSLCAMFDPPTTAPSGRAATLGMLIIDHFAVHDAGGREVPADDPILGGGGLYATVGARHFLPPRNVGFIADVGPDLPSSFREQLDTLRETVRFREREVTTRALNVYSGTRVGEGTQTFRYLVPRKQITPRDYARPGDAPIAWLHVVCDTQRAAAILDEVDALRAEGWTAKMAWEPLVRTDAKLDDYAALAARFDIFSPNHVELTAILGTGGGVEANAAAFAARCPTPLVVRAGAEGAYALSASSSSNPAASGLGPGWSGWVPAFWRAGEGAHIVDVTGGGNAFMGGMMAGMMLTEDLRAACIYGATAASFAIEQRGLPHLSTDGGRQMWNGADPWGRLREMARRTEEWERSR